jgi:putative SOS response-associated peptidase YedK
MHFSLTPAWSKERKVPFATFNARLDSVAVKPTWRLPFATRRGVVAMDGFIEPCYHGELAGTMVRFTPTALPQKSSGPLLWGAAVYDCWKDPTTQDELWSFALITDTPGEEVLAIGHDREPLFIRPEAIHEWLDPSLTAPEAVLATVPQIRARPALRASVERAMKPGWENRRRK